MLWIVAVMFRSFESFVLLRRVLPQTGIEVRTFGHKETTSRSSPVFETFCCYVTSVHLIRIDDAVSTTLVMIAGNPSVNLILYCSMKPIDLE
jgi:hypothetical protein